MSSNLDDTRRAIRLLRWYPSLWRERYGEEFVGHMEQEFADRPFDFKRSLNVAYKGIVARVGDVGLSKAVESSKGRTRAAVGTSFALTALAAVFALSFWSRTMIAWNAPASHRASVPDSVATGILTVVTGFLMVLLVAMLLSVAVLVVRQMMRRRARTLVGPSMLAVVSGTLLLYVARDVPGLLFGRNGTRVPWSHPGAAIKALAWTGWSLTYRLVDFWNQGNNLPTTFRGVLDALAPLAVVVFGVAIASLVRRVELPRIAERLGSVIVTLLGALTGAFFVTYVIWMTVGGPIRNQSFAWPQSPWSGSVNLVLLALVAVLVGRSGLLARKFERTTSANPDVNHQSIQSPISINGESNP